MLSGWNFAYSNGSCWFSIVYSHSGIVAAKRLLVFSVLRVLYLARIDRALSRLPFNCDVCQWSNQYRCGSGRSYWHFSDVQGRHRIRFRVSKWTLMLWERIIVLLALCVVTMQFPLDDLWSWQPSGARSISLECKRVASIQGCVSSMFTLETRQCSRALISCNIGFSYHMTSSLVWQSRSVTSACCCLCDQQSCHEPEARSDGKGLFGHQNGVAISDLHFTHTYFSTKNYKKTRCEPSCLPSISGISLESMCLL